MILRPSPSTKRVPARPGGPKRLLRLTTLATVATLARMGSFTLLGSAACDGGGITAGVIVT